MTQPQKFTEAKNTPRCPKHADCAMSPEAHPISQEASVFYWRCERCPGKLYMPDVPGLPR